MLKHKSGPGISKPLKVSLLLVLYFAVCFGGILGLNLYWTGSASFGYESLVFSFFIVALLALFLIPLLVIYKISSGKRGVTLVQLLSAGRSGFGLAFRIIRLPAGITLGLCLIPGLSAGA